MSASPSHRDLAAHLPQVTYFFGVPGVGKSFCASLLSELTGIDWYEADSDLPADIVTTIERKIPFTDEQRDRLYLHVGDQLLRKLSQGKKLIVSQATFKERHRALLRARIPDLCFVWVRASPTTIERRLTERGGILAPDYGKSIAQFFESPPESDPSLWNDGDRENVIREFYRLFAAR
jgi:gluconate kinase